MIRYDISPLDPEAHLYIVGITIDDRRQMNSTCVYPLGLRALISSATSPPPFRPNKLFWEKLLFRLKRSTKLLGA